MLVGMVRKPAAMPPAISPRSDARTAKDRMVPMKSPSSRPHRVAVARRPPWRVPAHAAGTDWYLSYLADAPPPAYHPASRWSEGWTVGPSSLAWAVLAAPRQGAAEGNGSSDRLPLSSVGRRPRTRRLPTSDARCSPPPGGVRIQGGRGGGRPALVRTEPNGRDPGRRHLYGQDS